ncbi:MAG: hypothetical protein IJI84_01895 [Clostridia bacterium]|nr:hypothetical protein [Clostridia bacterium]
MQKKIEQRGKNTYLLTVADGYDEKGKQIVKTKTIHASSQREAEKAYIEFDAEVKNNLVAYTGKLKITDFARQ